MSSTPRGQRTRTLIIESTAAVFDRMGFAGATLNHLVAATGLTRGAFYFHFDSKDALAEAIVQTQQERWLPIIDELEQSEPDPLRRLIRLTYRSGTLFQGDLVMRAGSRLMTERSLIRRELWRSYPWWVSNIRRLLHEAADDLGDLSRLDDSAWPPPDPAAPEVPRRISAVSEHMVGMWAGLQQQATAAGRNDLPERVRTAWLLTLPWLCRPERYEELATLVDELTETMRAAGRPNGSPGPAGAGAVAAAAAGDVVDPGGAVVVGGDGGPASPYPPDRLPGSSSSELVG